MSINIGDNNKVKNSTISENSNLSFGKKLKKTFPERHPVILSIIISFAVGFILLFSFWKDIVALIERLF